MIPIKNKLSIGKMATAGSLLVSVFEEIAQCAVAGVSTLELDSLIARKLEQKGLQSKMRGYRGYRYVSCISVNDEVVHGVPHASKVLKDGDLVKIDVCAAWNGYCADMARSYSIGKLSPEGVKLVHVAQRALDRGIECARAGNRLGDISAAIQKEVESAGFGVVRDFAGHGIGKHMHEEPEILNYGAPNTGPILQPGMAFAIEPMITAGAFDVFVESDGWTVKTADSSLAAHAEDTIIVTNGDPLIVTRAQKTNNNDGNEI